MNRYINYKGQEVCEIIKEVVVNEVAGSARVLVEATIFEGLTSDMICFYAYVPVLVVK